MSPLLYLAKPVLAVALYDLYQSFVVFAEKVPPSDPPPKIIVLDKLTFNPLKIDDALSANPVTLFFNAISAALMFRYSLLKNCEAL